MTGSATTPDADDSPWDELRRRAVEAAQLAYAPYSRLLVGAAARTADGVVLTGCNVENASYGLSLCAETVLAATLIHGGGGRLTHLTCRSGTGELLMPCGRCRQVLHEFGGPELLVEAPDGPIRLGELLPHAFGPEDVPD